ncbi:MAG: 23S rRNA (adenine(2503)-C(2))-methyltransferase [Planctomycetes bacterium RBG_16_64_10]|nr:MAG: 23S rRNA (adenine(2503)-C(2))-methyltransferase [Planctomycetes bacterium RBG_16_64_10]
MTGQPNPGSIVLGSCGPCQPRGAAAQARLEAAARCAQVGSLVASDWLTYLRCCLAAWVAMTHLLDWSVDQLRSWFRARRLPAYRGAQVYRWLFRQRARHWDDMTDLSKSLRAELADCFRLWTTQVARQIRAEDGTEKLLLELADGQAIEAVLLRERGRRTLCLSTQVGCAVGCTFCASGAQGIERNLSSGEIVEQMLRLQQLLDRSESISHIVVMGMGEPLANLNALLPALALARDPACLGISPRRITISTVGLPAAMRRLAREAPQYRLAVSLHAPNDPLRNQLVPANRHIGLRAILTEADRYYRASGRRLTFEYVLLQGINDQPEHARQLIRCLGRRTALVNVIPYNPIAGLPYRTPSARVQAQFGSILRDGGLRVEFRQRKGSSIAAACGQLRRAGHPAPGRAAPSKNDPDLVGSQRDPAGPSTAHHGTGYLEFDRTDGNQVQR